jgi:hypothetical protein
MGDGVGVNVVQGGEKSRSGKDGALAFWKGLQLEGKPSNGTKAAKEVSPNAVASTSTLPIPNPTIAPVPARPVVVPREQWFIRRALLAKDQKEREKASSAEGTPGPADVTSMIPAFRTATPSLASLLAVDLPPPPMDGEREGVEGFQPPAYFHLRENNRGWKVLKNIGWDGQGGLGRADDGSRPASVAASRQEDDVKREEGMDKSVVEKSRKGKGKSRESAIDLTLDSASSDSDSDQDSNPSNRRTPEKFGEAFINTPASSSRPPAGSGPGRTAPVATYLKTDLRGIGALSVTDRRRTLLRPNTLAAPPEGKRKRVTHSAQEIRAAVRDSRDEGGGLVGEERVMWERQGVKKGVEVDRKERQRWREIINRE